MILLLVAAVLTANPGSVEFASQPGELFGAYISEPLNVSQSLKLLTTPLLRGLFSRQSCGVGMAQCSRHPQNCCATPGNCCIDAATDNVNGCCPEGTCCETKGGQVVCNPGSCEDGGGGNSSACVNPGFVKCPDDNVCCPPGNTCERDQSNVLKCQDPSGGCATAGYVKCPGQAACCPPGNTCVRDSAQQLQCAPSSSPPPVPSPPGNPPSPPPPNAPPSSPPSTSQPASPPSMANTNASPTPTGSTPVVPTSTTAKTSLTTSANAPADTPFTGGAMARFCAPSLMPLLAVVLAGYLAVSCKSTNFTPSRSGAIADILVTNRITRCSYVYNAFLY